MLTDSPLPELCHVFQWTTGVSNILDWINWINISHPQIHIHICAHTCTPAHTLPFCLSSFFWNPPRVPSVLSTFHSSDKMSTRLRVKANPPLCLSAPLDVLNAQATQNAMAPTKEVGQVSWTASWWQEQRGRERKRRRPGGQGVGLSLNN